MQPSSMDRRAASEPIEPRSPHGRRRLLPALLSAQLLVAAALFPGCATIFSGTHQEVHLSSDPPGATVTVDHRRRSSTPTTISVERLRPPELRFEADGHEPVTLRIERRVNPIVLGNVFCLILPGLVVDFLSGAAYVLDDEVHVRLEPSGESPP